MTGTALLRYAVYTVLSGLFQQNLSLTGFPIRRGRNEPFQEVSGQTGAKTWDWVSGIVKLKDMRNIRLIVEYDGTAYCGWQRQENGLSIQQVLEESIGRMTGEESRVIGSGRTDAGVHAIGQVAHFHTASRLGERNFLMGINSLLPADITVREVREVDPSFHACFDVKSKVYVYRICNRPVRPALERQYAWFVWVSGRLAQSGQYRVLPSTPRSERRTTQPIQVVDWKPFSDPDSEDPYAGVSPYDEPK